MDGENHQNDSTVDKTGHGCNKKKNVCDIKFPTSDLKGPVRMPGNLRGMHITYLINI